MSQLAQIVSRMRIKGVTSEGGEAQYSDYLVKLDTDGKLSIEIIPDAVFTEVTTVANQAARLALAGTVNQGDLVIQTDTKRTYILSTGTGSVDGDWVSIALSDYPTALQVAFTATGSIASTNVQAAIAELDGDVTAHIANTSNPHAVTATQAAFTPAGSIAATNVQAAIAELDGDVTTVSSGLSTHIANTSNPHAVTATQTAFTPTGTVAATNVQTAIAELDTEKLATSLLPTSSNIIYVSKDANATDTRTGLSKYNSFRPFATIANAMGVAVSGDTIVVLPGAYTNIDSISWVLGVIIHFMPGAVLSGPATPIGAMFNISTNGPGNYIMTGHATVNIASSNGLGHFVKATANFSPNISITVDSVNTSGHVNNTFVLMATLGSAAVCHINVRRFYSATSGFITRDDTAISNNLYVTVDEYYGTGVGLEAIRLNYSNLVFNAKHVTFASTASFVVANTIAGLVRQVINIDRLILSSAYAGFQVGSSTKMLVTIGELYYTGITTGVFLNDVASDAQLVARVGRAFSESGTDPLLYAISGTTHLHVDYLESSYYAVEIVQGGEYATPANVRISGTYILPSVPAIAVSCFTNLVNVIIEGGSIFQCSALDYSPLASDFLYGIAGVATSNNPNNRALAYGSLVMGTDLF